MVCHLGWLFRQKTARHGTQQNVTPMLTARCSGNVVGHELTLDPDREPGAFATTHWSVVLKVGQNDVARAGAALEELSRKYWYPLYAFVRRRGTSSHDAEDLTQAFFTFLLEKETLKKVDRQRGRFRTFLLAAMTNYLNNEWHRQQTLKRGGRHATLSLDEISAEERYFCEPVNLVTPEKLFERRWALTLLEQALARLKRDYFAEGKAEMFAKLQTGLTGELAASAYSDWAAALGMSQGAVKMALHRMRRRFGEALRNEIADTVASPAEVDEELRHLLAVISD